MRTCRAALLQDVIGESGKPAYDWVFDASIAGSFALFSFGCIDWTDNRFANKDAILKEAQLHRPELSLTYRHGIVACTNPFRDDLQTGDVLVISKGLELAGSPRPACAVGDVGVDCLEFVCKRTAAVGLRAGAGSGPAETCPHASMRRGLADRLRGALVPVGRWQKFSRGYGPPSVPGAPFSHSRPLQRIVQVRFAATRPLAGRTAHWLNGSWDRW